MALENYKALTIAGSDTSGGAGMEADLKTFEEMGVYGMVALTVIVAQNPKDWAHDIFPIDLPTIERQIATVGEGIGINAMKTGMLGSAALVELVAKSIDKYNFKNVVIDPVMVCKGIDAIMVPEAAEAIKSLLVKKADVITPNTVESAYLAGMEKVETVEDIKEQDTITSVFHTEAHLWHDNENIRQTLCQSKEKAYLCARCYEIAA